MLKQAQKWSVSASQSVSQSLLAEFVIAILNLYHFSKIPTSDNGHKLKKATSGSNFWFSKQPTSSVASETASQDDENLFDQIFRSRITVNIAKNYKN